MDTPQLCPFRYIWKGRTFCAIAIRQRRYTTTEVMPGACAGCRARGLLEGIGCAHLNLGVEVDQYGGGLSVDNFYASCEKLMERLIDFSDCGEACPLWAPFDPELVNRIRDEALAALKEKETNQED